MVEAEAIKVTGEQPGRVGDPCVMVIFGASGDLTKRKLIPALYNLAREDLLSQEFAVVGLARSGMSSEAFREKLTGEMKDFATGPFDLDLWQRFVQRLYSSRRWSRRFPFARMPCGMNKPRPCTPFNQSRRKKS